MAGVSLNIFIMFAEWNDVNICLLVFINDVADFDVKSVFLWVTVVSDNWWPDFASYLIVSMARVISICQVLNISYDLNYEAFFEFAL